MYIHIYIYVYTCIYIYILIHTYIFIYMYLFVYTYIYVHINTYIYIYVYIFTILGYLLQCNLKSLSNQNSSSPAAGGRLRSKVNYFNCEITSLSESLLLKCHSDAAYFCSFWKSLVHQEKKDVKKNPGSTRKRNTSKILGLICTYFYIFFMIGVFLLGLELNPLYRVPDQLWIQLLLNAANVWIFDCSSSRFFFSTPSLSLQWSSGLQKPFSSVALSLARAIFWGFLRNWASLQMSKSSR